MDIGLGAEDVPFQFEGMSPMNEEFLDPEDVLFKGKVIFPIVIIVII